MEYAKDFEIPGILEINAPLIEEQAKYRHLSNRFLAEISRQKSITAATLLIAVSEEVSKYLKTLISVHNKIHVIPNGVNTKFFNESLQSTYHSNKFTIGFIGSMKPWHGLPVLLDAFELLHKKVQDARLLIVGDGPERIELVKTLRQKNLLDSTEITGTIPRDKVPYILSSFDIAVAPYPQLENFYFSPLKVYEYMASGLPVVASRIGQLKELIFSGENGILVSPGNPLELANAFYKLYCDPIMRKNLGKNARKTVIDFYDWDIVAKRILNLCGLKLLFQKDKKKR